MKKAVIEKMTAFCDLSVVLRHLPCKVVAMKQMFCFFGTGVVQIFAIKRLDSCVFVRKTQLGSPVQLVKNSAARYCLFAVAAVYRLAAAARAAARAGHDLDKFVFNYLILKNH